MSKVNPKIDPCGTPICISEWHHAASL